jgi:hypothetical protein
MISESNIGSFLAGTLEGERLRSMSTCSREWYGTHTQLPSPVKKEETASTSCCNYETRLVSRFHSLHHLWVTYVYLGNQLHRTHVVCYFELFERRNHVTENLWGIFSFGIWESIVAYRPVVKRGLCKQLPLLGNACNMHTRDSTMIVGISISRSGRLGWFMHFY